MEQQILIVTNGVKFDPIMLCLDELPDNSQLEGQPDKGMIQNIEQNRAPIPAAIIVKKVDGVWVVKDGRRRLKSQREAQANARRRGDNDLVEKLDMIPCEIIDGTKLDIIRNTIGSHYHRGHNVITEVKDVLELAHDGLDEEKIKAVLHLDTRQVRRLLSFGKLIPDIYNMFVSGQISDKFAYKLTKISREDQKQLFAAYAADEGAKFNPAFLKAWEQNNRRAVVENMMLDLDFGDDDEDFGGNANDTRKPNVLKLIRKLKTAIENDELDSDEILLQLADIEQAI